jgi:hypothetical protein
MRDHHEDGLLVKGSDDRMRSLLIASLLLVAAPVAAQTTTPGTYIDRWTLSTTPTFIGRIQMATAVTAGNVLLEPATTPNHAARLALAQLTMKEPALGAARIAPMMAAVIPVTSTDHDSDPATPPVVNTTWTDAEIQTLIDSQWNLLASAFMPPAAPPTPPGVR